MTTQPENSDLDWVYVYNKNKTIKEQALFDDDNHYLLNVRKMYTNNIYFGVQYTTLDKSLNIYHQFRCRDRGFPEDLVDDKTQFLNKYKSNINSALHRTLNDMNTDFQEMKASFLQEYDLTFLYDQDGFYHSSLVWVDGALIRGLYGATDEKTYERNMRHHGFSTYQREPTESEVNEYLIKKAYISLSNVITRVNTEYSDIKVYHKTEI